MKDIAAIDKDYKQWISEIRGRYRQSQIKVVVKRFENCQQVVDESMSHNCPQVADNFNRPIILQLAEELSLVCNSNPSFLPSRSWKMFWRERIIH